MTGNFTPNNAAGVPTGAAFGRFSLADFRQNQLSEELQAVGTLGRVDFVAGALYYQERVQDSATAYFTATFTNAIGSTYSVANIDPATVALQRASYVKTTSTGVYGQATYTPSFAGDIAHLTAGLRYTNDDKRGSLFTVNGVAPSPPGYPANTPLPLNYSNARVDPLVNLAIDLAADVHVYGKWSTGYRSGGANSRSLTYASFDPETVSMFELGAKTEFWHHRARVNLAVYTGSYDDIQLDFSGQYQRLFAGVLVNTTRTTTNTVNSPANGRLKGVEVDVTVAPARGLTLSANYAYNSVKIPPTINPFPPSLNSPVITVPIPIYQVYTPENVFNAGLDYAIPLRRATIKLHLNADYTQGFYAGYVDSAYDPVTHLPSYLQPKGDDGLVVDGRLALADIAVGTGGGKLTVAIWARNLLDERHLFFRAGTPTGGVVGFFNNPRTVGAEVNVRF